MKRFSLWGFQLVLTLLLATAAVAAEPPANSKAKILAPQSIITVKVNGLSCSTPLGAGMFNAMSWSWGAVQVLSNDIGGGGGAGKPTISDLNVQKSFDTCSPALFAAVVSGKHFTNVTLTQEDTNNNVLLTVSMTDVLVSSWNIGGSQKSEVPMESVSFDFRKVCIKETAHNTEACFDKGALSGF